MRILVTGASGLLGATVVYTARADHTVAACSCRTALHADGFETAQLDLTDRAAFAGVGEAFRPDWICHCAALTNVDLCERSPELARQQNVVTTEVVAHEAARLGAHLLVVSTDSVFDGQSRWYRETDEPRPLNHYASSKLEAERAAASIVPGAILARTNLYGWNIQPKQSLAEWMLAEIRAGVRIPGWDDVAFTPLFTGDLAQLLLQMMAGRLEGLFHIGGADRCSKYEFGRAIARVWQLNPDQLVPTGIGTMLATRPRDTSLCSEKLTAALGEATPGLDAGLERMRAWETTELPRLRRLLA